MAGPVNRYIVAVALGAALAVPSAGAAQSTGGPVLHGSAVMLGTLVAPGLDGRRLLEGYITQPNLMAHGDAWSGRLFLSAVLNLEAVTLRRGELNTGIWGEGYVDRRHPHSLSHEVMLTFSPVPRTASLRPAISFGKGFVPFGTDDPMVRPFVKFPINHHLSQLLERGQVILAAGGRYGVLEAAWFNGDEPATPHSGVRLSRFADSWAARAIAWIVPSVELSASFAAVASPEVPDGTGLDQRKWNLAARYASYRASGRMAYALAEYSHTRDYDDEHPGLPARSLLAEGSYDLIPAVQVAVRLERTDRLEEERLADPFRSPRPHYDAHQIGTTRWDSGTVGVMLTRHSHWRPFLEVGRLRATARPGPSFFDPGAFYGSDRIWTVSAGARVGFGSPRQMGRYGPALRPAVPGHHSQHDEHE